MDNKVMKFILNSTVIEKEQDEISKNCKHEIIDDFIYGTRYRYCKHCGIKAHSDGDYSYLCGSDWCKCCN